jgi:hypothetical protein
VNMRISVISIDFGNEKEKTKAQKARHSKLSDERNEVLVKKIISFLKE